MSQSSVDEASFREVLADFWTFAILVLAVSTPFFLLFPQVDIAVSALFYTPEKGFAGNSVSIERLRNAFKLIYIAACVAAVAGVLYARASDRLLFGLRGVQHLFLITCLALGPGVVTNLALKDQWGRARPREIVQFGGSKIFTPPILPAQQCKRNCSFVSGEASSMYMVFFAAAFAYRRRMRELIGLGLAAGLTAGLVRIGQGGHFLSDVIFAGIAMALTVVAIDKMFQMMTGVSASDDAP